MKKKIFAAVLVVTLLAVTGSAFAYGRGGYGNNRGGRGGYGGQQGGHDCYTDGGYGGRGSMMNGQGFGFGGGGRFGGQRMYGQQQGRFGGRGQGGGYGFNSNSNVQISDEMRAKFAEVQKLNIDLRTEFQKRPADKAKILEIRSKMNAVRQEISDWQFNQYLNSIN